MSEHAKLSPSAAHRWLHCSASILYPNDGKSSAAADRGSYLHSIAEQLLKGKPCHASDEYRAEVAQYVGYVNAIASERFPSHVLIEQRVDWNSDIWGTADAIIVSPTRIDICDLKTGSVPVDAEGNDQMLIYAAAALRSLEHLIDVECIFTIGLHICQPGNFNSWEITIEELRSFESDLERKYEWMCDSMLEYAPSEHACQWCPGRNRCPARSRAVVAAVSQDFDVIVATTPGKLNLPTPDSLTPLEIAALVPHFKELLKWAEDVQEHALELMVEQIPLPGLKLVRSQTRREWVSDELAITNMRDAGLLVKDCTVLKPISIGAAEKIMGKGNPKIESATQESSWRPMVVVASDKRPELTPRDALKRLNTKTVEID